MARGKETDKRSGSRGSGSRGSGARKTGAARKCSADDWVMAGLSVLSKGSISDVKVERLAKDLGVTKGSFYWHFDDRPALLAAILATWVRIDTEQIIEFVDGRVGADDPVASLEQLLRVTVGSTTEFDGVEAGIREWSAHDVDAAAVSSKVDQRRLDYVAGLLIAAGVDQARAKARAGIIYRVVIGEYSWRRYGGEPADLDELLVFVRSMATP